MIKTIIFDFDETLCMSEKTYFYIENEVLRRMGRKPMSREIHRSTWIKNMYIAITERSPGIDVDEFRKIFLAVRKEFTDNLLADVVPDRSITAIDNLINDGLQIMILTSRSLVDIEHMLKPNHPLSSRITAIYHKDNNPYSKPDIRAFKIIENEHGFKPDECVYVGDAPNDAAAAKGAGLYFIATLESKMWMKKDLNKYPVDEFIETLTDVVGAVKRIQSMGSSKK